METKKDNNDYTRRNRFTGESIELTKDEAIKHDQIFYHEALATLEDKDMATVLAHWDIVRKHLDWFMKTMPKPTWYYFRGDTRSALRGSS